MASTGQGVLGNNMLCYCLNNPVLLSDSFGSRAFYRDATVEDNSMAPDTLKRTVEKWIVKAKRKASTNTDMTLATGYTLSGAFGAAASISAGITIDLKGNIGFIFAVNGGGGFPNVSFGQYGTITSAPTIYHQEGLGTVVGASGGTPVVSIGGEYNMLIDTQSGTAYHGATISGSTGFLPTCVEVHGEVGYSWVHGWNIFDLARDALCAFR